MDFWNNPLVVSAMRLKYRRSSPGILAAVWAMALLALGVAAALHRPADSPFPSPRPTWSSSSASSSSSARVAGPDQHLQLDERRGQQPHARLPAHRQPQPAVHPRRQDDRRAGRHLFPDDGLRAVRRPLLGLRRRRRASEILFLYVNLATFIAHGRVAGAHPLAEPARRRRHPAARPAPAAWCSSPCFVILPQLLDPLRPGDGRRRSSARLLQLLTPIGSLMSFWDGNAWHAHVIAVGRQASVAHRRPRRPTRRRRVDRRRHVPPAQKPRRSRRSPNAAPTPPCSGSTCCWPASATPSGATAPAPGAWSTASASATSSRACSWRSPSCPATRPSCRGSGAAARTTRALRDLALADRSEVSLAALVLGPDGSRRARRRLPACRWPSSAGRPTRKLPGARCWSKRASPPWCWSWRC